METPLEEARQDTELSTKAIETFIPKTKVRIVRRPKLEEWAWPKIIAEYVPNTWDEVFARTAGERKTIAQVLSAKALSQYGDLYPAKENLYKAFDLTPLPKVKVVIVGQDPYPQAGKAQGLSFSISPTDPQIPGSLKNIYKEIKNEYPDFQIPNHGDLRGWSRQGVLLLNMALTVPPGERNAHRGVWKPFIVKTIKEIVERYPNTIFVLWGNDAQKLVITIGNAPTLVSGHPSPEAVNRGGNFIGNGHFKEINRILEERGELPIDWQI